MFLFSDYSGAPVKNVCRNLFELGETSQSFAKTHLQKSNTQPGQNTPKKTSVLVSKMRQPPHITPVKKSTFRSTTPCFKAGNRLIIPETPENKIGSTIFNHNRCHKSTGTTCIGESPDIKMSCRELSKTTPRRLRASLTAARRNSFYSGASGARSRNWERARTRLLADHIKGHADRRLSDSASQLSVNAGFLFSNILSASPFPSPSGQMKNAQQTSKQTITPDKSVLGSNLNIGAGNDSEKKDDNSVTTKVTVGSPPGGVCARVELQNKNGVATSMDLGHTPVKRVRRVLMLTTPSKACLGTSTSPEREYNTPGSTGTDFSGFSTPIKKSLPLIDRERGFEVTETPATAMVTELHDTEYAEVLHTPQNKKVQFTLKLSPNAPQTPKRIGTPKDLEATVALHSTTDTLDFGCMSPVLLPTQREWYYHRADSGGGIAQITSEVRDSETNSAFCNVSSPKEVLSCQDVQDVANYPDSAHDLSEVNGPVHNVTQYSGSSHDAVADTDSSCVSEDTNISVDVVVDIDSSQGMAENCSSLQYAEEEAGSLQHEEEETTSSQGVDDTGSSQSMDEGSASTQSMDEDSVSTHGVNKGSVSTQGMDEDTSLSQSVDEDIGSIQSEDVTGSSKCVDEKSEPESIPVNWKSSQDVDEDTGSTQSEYVTFSSQCVEEESGSSESMAKNRKFSHGLDEDTGSTQSEDKGSGSSQGTEEDTDSSQAMDEDALCSQSMGSSSSQGTDEGTDSSQNVDKDTGPIHTTAEVAQDAGFCDVPEDKDSSKNLEYLGDSSHIVAECTDDVFSMAEDRYSVVDEAEANCVCANSEDAKSMSFVKQSDDLSLTFDARDDGSSSAEEEDYPTYSKSDLKTSGTAYLDLCINA
ncbi:Eukaryotic translation initiation factor 3 subunit A [Portunus trituberculatus]|uniref:Eukaryotic translation initiation factor 3 subunit A n=1 Tax=Portunus trituberculatus TaxID=210409 RepID=A0A5B7CHL9_PORTR|nr:Eukaryotic translation initiation factor 3 subunit A [Portunus trituberculatus]